MCWWYGNVRAYPFDLEFPQITDRPHLQQWSVDIPSDLDWEKNWQEEYVDVTKRCASVCEDADLLYAPKPHPYQPHVKHSLHAPVDRAR